MAEALTLALEGFRDYIAGLTSGSPASSVLKDVFWQTELDVKKPLDFPCGILRLQGFRPHVQGEEVLAYCDIALELRIHSPTRDSEGDIIGKDRSTPDSTTVAYMGLARLVEYIIRKTYYVNRSQNSDIVPCIRYQSAGPPMRESGYVSIVLMYEGLLALSDTSLRDLSWTTQPPDTTAATVFVPNPVVTSSDASFTGDVTVSLIDPGATGATLGGTLTQTAVAGVATFTDLEVDTVGTYQLKAVAPGYDAVLSDSFTISGLP